MLAPITIVMPVRDEDETIVAVLERLFDVVRAPCEVLAVYDAPEDRTRPLLERYAAREPRLVPMLNTYGPGPAMALRFAFDHASHRTVVVTMGDGTDDATQIDVLAALVERGAVLAAASRYMRGGQQVDAARIKSTLSRLAGVTLCWLGRVGTHDATNSFKAYDRCFVQEVGIDARRGFELGIEMVAKARRRRRHVAEIPTISAERTSGTSKFRLFAWLPAYLRWYFHALGPRSSVVGPKRLAGTR